LHADSGKKPEELDTVLTKDTENNHRHGGSVTDFRYNPADIEPAKCRPIRS
jgi:hypothetical protein